MSESDQVEMWWTATEEPHVVPRLRPIRTAPKAPTARLRKGQRRQDQRDRPTTRQLSRTAKQVLALLTDVPQKEGEIRAQTGHTHNQEGPALYSLAQHGLAEKLPTGWVRRTGA